MAFTERCSPGSALLRRKRFLHIFLTMRDVSSTRELDAVSGFSLVETSTLLAGSLQAFRYPGKPTYGPARLMHVPMGAVSWIALSLSPFGLLQVHTNRNWRWQRHSRLQDANALAIRHPIQI